MLSRCTAELAYRRKGQAHRPLRRIYVPGRRRTGTCTNGVFPNSSNVTSTDLGIIPTATSKIPATLLYMLPIFTTLSVTHEALWRPGIYQISWTVRTLNNILCNTPCLALLSINLSNLHGKSYIRHTPFHLISSRKMKAFFRDTNSP